MEPAALGRSLAKIALDRLFSSANSLLNQAKDLKLGDCMTDDGTEQVFLTTTGFAVKQAMAELRKRNIATAPLFRQAGLSEQDVERAIVGGNPAQHRISAIGQCKFLNLAAEATGDAAFGLRLAEKTDPRGVGIFFYVVSGGQNIDEALKLFARYHRIANDAVRIKVVRSADGVVVEAHFIGLPVQMVRQNVEFAFAIVLKGLREVAGRKLCPTRVAFAHARTSNMKEFERFFLCPVEFDRAAVEGVTTHLLEFANETLAVPLVTADPKLIDALKPFCDLAAKERSTSTGTLRSAVEREVEKLLPNGKAQAQNVAKALAISVRTLSRRLAEERTNYAEVVDQLRRSLALQYLKESAMSLSQISWLLGYEGSTSFNHAFKRWTGRSPSTARNKKQLTASLRIEPETT